MTFLSSLQDPNFERDIGEAQKQIDDLAASAEESGLDVSAEISELRAKLENLKEWKHKDLTPMEQVEMARHQDRPYTLDYIDLIFTDWIELHGDRSFRDDEAIIGGWASIGEHSVMVVGHQKGRDIKENLRRNFGMAHPEGYRKSIRLMHLAEKFNIPVITFVDTPGAYPGIGAEERGQSEAIARSTDCTLSLKVPVISVIIGEGGSGGAMALAAANNVLMLEHSIYTVASPEASASILWRSSEKAKEAANAMKITAQDLLRLGIIDQIIDEPVGGAHREPTQMISQIKSAIIRSINELRNFNEKELIEKRREKFIKIGQNL